METPVIPRFAGNLLARSRLKTLVTELLVRLRGETFSQRALSEALGYASNVVYLWEAGRRTPSVEQVMSVVSMTSDLPAALEEASRLRRADQVMADIRGITAHADLAALADAVNVSERTFARWRAGETAPDFVQYLGVLESTSGAALDFVATFVCPHDLPSVCGEWTRRQEVRSLLTTVPLAPRLLAMLELDGHLKSDQPSREWLATSLDRSTADIVFVLERLEDVGLVAWSEGRLRSLLSPADLMGPMSRTNVAPALHAAVSPQGRRELQLATREFMARVAQIWSRDQSTKTEVAVVTVASVFDTPS